MNPQRLTELLTNLVGAKSVNPAHSDDRSVTGEQRMADRFEQLLKDRGFQTEQTFPIGEGRPAVIARSVPPSATDTPHHTLMFGVHLDTVGIDRMTVDPFVVEERDGKLYGRGTCDMKGSIAALLYACTPERVDALARRGISLLIVGTPDEECGMGGARALAESDLHADAAVILEPTRCAPVIAHKSAHWVEVELRGRSGHGSQPESGVSTNAALSTVLAEMFALHNRLNDQYTHPVLGTSSINIGKVSGGSTFNIIPENTCIQVDRRIIPNEPPEAFDDGVRNVIQNLVDNGRLISGSVTVKAHTRSFETDPDSPLVQALKRSIHSVTGSTPESSGTSWVSDAAPFSSIADEILVFGPGDIAQAHTADEYIRIDQLETGAEIFANFLETYHPVAD